MRKGFHVLALSVAASLTAQGGIPAVSAAESAEVVDRLATVIGEQYVFAERGKACAEALRRALAAGKLGAGPVVDFVLAVNGVLAASTADAHLRVGFSPLMPRKEGADEKQRQADEARAGRSNFGFVEARLLAGNVGYLRLDAFEHPEVAGDTARAAMQWFAHADALVIDLRHNHGGSGGMVRLLYNHLFGERRLLYTQIDRAGEGREEWTAPAKPRLGMPLFVVTGRTTFSAAEGFAFVLQQAGRARVVGERTAGGAHPGRTERLGERFAVFVPLGRIACAPDGKDWEGTGVVPDLPCAGERAVATAHAAALRGLLGATAADATARRRELAWSLTAAEAAASPPEVDTVALRECAGRYGERVVVYQDGALWYRRGENARARMLPLGGLLFGFAEAPDYRVAFERRDGAVVALVGRFRDGHEERSARDR